MIIYMCNNKNPYIICVTNRLLCEENFLERIKKITDTDISYLILREKDLDEESYFELARSVIKICNDAGKKCILHNFYDVAISLNHKNIHLPIPVLKEIDDKKLNFFDIKGASAHSIKEAELAIKKNCNYITLSHIFKTDCKRGLKEKGIGLIKDVKEKMDICIYGLGGINEKNASDVIKAGADGICIMSGFMKCDDPKSYVEKIRSSI